MVNYLFTCSFNVSHLNGDNLIPVFYLLFTGITVFDCCLQSPGMSFCKVLTSFDKSKRTILLYSIVIINRKRVSLPFFNQYFFYLVLGVPFSLSPHIINHLFLTIIVLFLLCILFIAQPLANSKPWPSLLNIPCCIRVFFKE